ncbi:DMT family transporter [Castellaniella sp.]|uniref:DMT family transporter n=1 Tax=Castellaniella sp. TaxID=1955812 RepID=UPI003C7746F2
MSDNEPTAWIKASPAIFLLLWSSGFVFLKLGLDYADPITFLALRYVLVVGALLLPALWIRPAFPATLRSWGALVGVGICLQAGYFAFTYLSLRHGMTAGTIALITSQQPILVGLLAPVVARERVTPARWAGLLLGVGGAVIVIVGNSRLEVTSTLGLAFGVMALVSMASSTLIEKRYAEPVHPIAANLVQYSMGLAICAPLAYALEPMHIEWSWPLIGSLTYLVFCNSLLAISLLLAMIRRGEASRVSALFFLVPPVTALIAYLVLGETLALESMPGVLLTVIGIYLVIRKS